MRLEARSVALAIAAIACSSAAVVGVACIIVPPAETQQPPDEPPRIVSVQPDPSVPLLEWPEGGFIVGANPEWPENPTAPPAFYIFIDPLGQPASPVMIPNQLTTPPNDAGVSMITFSITRDLGIDDQACHTVVLIVARSFINGYVAQAPGPASVTWTYAGPNAPYDCIGPSLDGQPPPPDAADGSFTPPSEAGGPDL